MKSKHFHSNPQHKSFFRLPSLWITVITIVLISSLISLLIIYNTPLTLQLNADGFNQFLSIFRFPLGILTLLIPIVGLLAANHRSLQTSAQLIAATEQNRFSNYYKHADEFSKYISEHTDNFKFSIQSPRQLHNLFFPRATEGIYSVDAEHLMMLNDQLDKVYVLMRRIGSGDSAEQSIMDIEDIFKDKISRTGFELKGVSGRQIVVNQRMATIPKKLRGYYNEIKLRAMTIQMVLEFDHTFIASKALRALCDIDINRIPPDIETDQLDKISPFEPFPDNT